MLMLDMFCAALRTQCCYVAIFGVCPVGLGRSMVKYSLGSSILHHRSFFCYSRLL